MDFAYKHMSFWQQTYWFAIRTKTRREGFAAGNVNSLGLEVFFPRIKLSHCLDQGAQRSSQPLFSGYFFARFCPEVSLSSVECSHGVLQVVRSGRYPVPVDECAIQEIQQRVEADGLIKIHRHRLEPGDRVAIQSGPFEGMMARVEREWDGEKRVAILLETLSCARVLIEKRRLEVAA